MGDKHLRFDVCIPVPQGSNVEAGIENWDAYLKATMEFDKVACASGNSHTTIAWETNQCGGGFHYACWDWGDWIDRGTYKELVKTTIWLHPSNFPSLSTAWQVTSGAHEWGHNLSLDHHNEETPCNLPGVMGLASVSQEPVPCFQAPAGGEVFSVECAVYYSCGWQPPGSWSNLVSTGSPTTKGLARASGAQTDPIHMVRTYNNDVWVKYQAGGVWTGWINWSTDSAIAFNYSAAISNHAGQIHVVATSGTGNLYYKTSLGGTWQLLGKPAGTSGFGPIAVSNTGGEVDVVGITGGNAWFQKKVGGGAWSGWQFLGGGTLSSSVAIATSPHGLIHVVAFGPNATVMMSWWNSQTWVSWQPLGGVLDGGLAIDNSFADRGNTAPPYTAVHVAALSSSVVHVRCWETYCGSGWTGIGGAFQAPLAIANYGEVPVLAISSNVLYGRTYGP